MFKKVLIANRGEIALRIIKTLKKLGIGSVAVYSEPDKNLKYVSEADESIALGGQKAVENYLVVEKILSAAKDTGAQAIHPGYGFLSENAGFAQIVQDSGLKFIGPSPKSIALMGDKEKARNAMAKAGLPILPGFSTESLSENEILAQAQSIGYPVLIKASFGGGGIGISLVQDSHKLIATLTKVQDAAKRNFGKGGVYVEKYLVNAKHIEFQVAADDSGEIICLGARECSAQRRNQKLIEESPSLLQVKNPTGLKEAQNQLLGALRFVGYSNVGTIEMLASAGKFYFMEMNTRLQVEHRVTEMLTGLDLVEIQLRLANGEALRDICNSVETSGHAIEFRICAEDPNNFFPAPGRILEYHEPHGHGILVDSGFGRGDEVTPYYDSLLAKLVVHAKDRPTALLQARDALNKFRIEGIRHNIPLHLRILDQELFVNGEYNTKFVESLPKVNL